MRSLFAFDLILLLLTLIGAPAPDSIGPVELATFAMICLVSVVAVVRVARGRNTRLTTSQSVVLAAIALYLASFVVSLLAGIVRGVPIAAALRSVIPYLVFAPVMILGVAFKRDRATIESIRSALIIAGTVQAVYMIGLYVTGVQSLLDLNAVYLGRTTLLDARTTVPLFLASAILPLSSLVEGSSRFARLRALVVMAISVLAALSTQTRSQLVAIAVAYLFFAFCGSVWRTRALHQSFIAALARFATVLIVGGASVAVVGASVAPVRILARTLAMRTEESVDTGRREEWGAAADRIVSGGPITQTTGIGAGSAFTTDDGESRTYVHNLTIYSLLYNGFVGLVGVFLLYVVVTATLVRNAFIGGHAAALSLSALLVSQYVYAQFFAVHKLLSYNVMVAIICQAALVGAAPLARRRAGRVSPAGAPDA